MRPDFADVGRVLTDNAELARTQWSVARTSGITQSTDLTFQRAASEDMSDEEIPDLATPDPEETVPQPMDAQCAPPHATDGTTTAVHAITSYPIARTRDPLDSSQPCSHEFVSLPASQKKKVPSQSHCSRTCNICVPPECACQLRTRWLKRSDACSVRQS